MMKHSVHRKIIDISDRFGFILHALFIFQNSNKLITFFTITIKLNFFNIFLKKSITYLPFTLNGMQDWYMTRREGGS